MKVTIILLLTAVCGVFSNQEIVSSSNRSCLVDGNWYSDGSLTPDDCDRCRCRSGLIFCNRRGCPQGVVSSSNRSCLVDGNWYSHGSLTPDDCNRCRCRSGLNICNRRGCPPKSNGKLLNITLQHTV